MAMRKLFDKLILRCFSHLLSYEKKNDTHVSKSLWTLILLRYYTGMVGELYLRMLKIMIVPLIIASVITGKLLDIDIVDGDRASHYSVRYYR